MLDTPLILNFLFHGLSKLFDQKSDIYWALAGLILGSPKNVWL